mgnify:CR=1 FL=1
MIKALIVDQADDDSVSASFHEIEASQLPDDGEVDIAVEYSTINYKDGLCLNGLGRLVRNYPHVPGIDLAGTVISSRADGIAAGDRVTMNGFRSGEIRWGGYATRANGKAEWIVKLPDGMSTRHSQMLGTAGFTAMQSILRLEANGMTVEDAGPAFLKQLQTIGAKMQADWLASVGADGQAIVDAYKAM